jgi:REP element-mobilizing transposase RayT
MARKHREDFEGAWHHVMHRGARRAPIFIEDVHCLDFLRLLEDLYDRFELEIHAYSLMPNHYHLLVRSRHGNLSDAMRHLNGAYTQRVNRLERWDGPVFRGRFTSKLIRDETRLPFVLAYIHLNPLRANLVTRIDARCWTSLRAYLGKDTRPDWLCTDYFLDLFENGEKLREHTLALHRKKREWPEDMDLEWGFFRKQDEVATCQNQSRFQSRFVDADTLLDAVRRVTGAPLSELKTARQGPRANPARRFAVWALTEHTLLTHREIGSLLDMSVNQTSKVVTRFNGSKEPLASWMNELTIYMSSGGVWCDRAMPVQWKGRRR